MLAMRPNLVQLTDEADKADEADDVEVEDDTQEQYSVVRSRRRRSVVTSNQPNNPQPSLYSISQTLTSTCNNPNHVLLALGYDTTVR